MTERDPSRLFAALSVEFNRYILEQKSQLERDVLIFPATEGHRLGQTLFTNLKNGGFCTLVVTGRRDWDPRSHYFEAARTAARRGCTIERAALLPHRHGRHDPLLKELLELDSEAGISTAVLYVGDLIARRALPIAESLEFGIWDDAIGCVGVRGPGRLASGVAEWRVTPRAEVLQTLGDIKLLLREQAVVLDSSAPSAALELEEPMITTAPIAHELAAVLCQGNHVSSEDCSWYHSIWQYLRIFNMVSTPTWHSQFYLNTLRNFADLGQYRRILISGTADYSMLAHVLWAYKQMPTPPAVTILDLCDTPLLLCKWYAKSISTPVDTVAVDIQTYQPDLPFDVVATDAFLTRFSKESRRAVVRSWHNLLRPAGRVVTTVRLEPGLSRPIAKATPEQADAFRRKAFDEAQRWQGFLTLQPERIAVLAQRYAERMISYSFGSDGEITSLFQEEGFAVTSLSTVEVPGEMASTTYAELVAERV